MNNVDLQALYGQPQPSMWESAYRGLGSATGIQNQLAGGIGYGLGQLSQFTGIGPGAVSYSDMRDMAAQENTSAQQANPLTYGGSQLVGAIPLIAGPTGMIRGTLGAGRLAADVGANALYGAAQGAGSTTANQTAGQGLLNTATGLFVGGGLGAGPNILGKGLNAVTQYTLNKIGLPTAEALTAAKSARTTTYQQQAGQLAQQTRQSQSDAIEQQFREQTGNVGVDLSPQMQKQLDQQIAQNVPTPGQAYQTAKSQLAAATPQISPAATAAGRNLLRIGAGAGIGYLGGAVTGVDPYKTALGGAVFGPIILEPIEKAVASQAENYLGARAASKLPAINYTPAGTVMAGTTNVLLGDRLRNLSNQVSSTSDVNLQQLYGQ